MEETTVASAVLMPEPSEVRELSPTLKRRQSSIDSSEAKRPRLSPGQTRDSRSPPPTGANGQDRRRSSVRGGRAVEEKKRGQRLFGAILGTLSQSSASTGQRKRAEVEKKQIEKLKARRVEDEERKQKKKEELLAQRRQQQTLWEEEGLRIRHKNMFAMAHFLKTKAEPPLYYKPWELRPEEEEMIQKHISETQEIIDRETTELEVKHRRHERDDGDVGQPDANGHDHETTEITGSDSKMESAEEERKEIVETTDTAMQDSSIQPSAEVSATEENGTHVPNDQTPADDHAGEELVQDQEDDVIY